MDQEMRKVIALGFFDGVHLGHQALLRRAVDRAREKGFTPAVFTFDRSPREFVTGVPVPLLTTPEERRMAAQELFGIEEVIVAPFDRALMTMPWVDFVLMLAQRYRAGWLVAGHSFRFGHKNSGTPTLLSRKAEQLGIGCDIIPAVTLDGVTVSSTHIRGGSRLGAPTINLIPPEGHLVPAYGVYAARVTVDSQVFPAVTNVGVRPTVDENGGVTVESHLLDEKLGLYGEICRVEFLHRLRPERRFDDLEALRQQIIRDAEEARSYFAQSGGITSSVTEN